MTFHIPGTSIRASPNPPDGPDSKFELGILSPIFQLRVWNTSFKFCLNLQTFMGKSGRQLGQLLHPVLMHFAADPSSRCWHSHGWNEHTQTPRTKKGSHPHRLKLRASAALSGGLTRGDDQSGQRLLRKPQRSVLARLKGTVGVDWLKGSREKTEGKRRGEGGGVIRTLKEDSFILLLKDMGRTGMTMWRDEWVQLLWVVSVQ